MRVLINFATYVRDVSIHCLAEDAQTVLSGFRKVASEGTLYRLIAYVGGNEEQCREEMRKWGHGGTWADVPDDRLHLLGITSESRASVSPITGKSRLG